MAAPVIVLSAQGRFPVWAAVLILVREVGISLLRAFLGTRGQSMPASWPAKVKTTVQLAAITMYILPLGAGWDAAKLTVLVVAVAAHRGDRSAVRGRGPVAIRRRRAARRRGSRRREGRDRRASGPSCSSARSRTRTPRWMSEQLAEIGVDVLHHQAVGDNLERIAEALRLAAVPRRRRAS